MKTSNPKFETRSTKQYKNSNVLIFKLSIWNLFRPQLAKNLKLGSVFLFLLTFTLTLFYSFTLVKAQEDAIPKPGVIPCDEEKDPEYSSGRPYQASPCGGAPITYWCGNSVVVNVARVSCPYNGNPTCVPAPGSYNQDPKIVIDLTDVEIPILGNTDNTKNSETQDDLDDGTKVNNYLAWYLGGVNDKAEYEASSIDQLVNFAGPVKKLLPGIIQDSQRIRTIDSSTELVTTTDDETQETITEPTNHNQIVVCAKQGGGGLLGWFQDLLGIGKSNPVPCYDGGGKNANNDVYRLKSWEGELSFANVVGNALVSTALNYFKLLYPFIPTGALEASIGDHYNFRKPPLPWDDGTGKPFASGVLYQKAYFEWRGQTCVILPIINRLACFENYLVPNKYADLFPYIPLGNPVDKIGRQAVTMAHITVPRGKYECKDKGCYELIHSPRLWIPHTLENFELSELLKSTYKSKDQSTSRQAPKGVTIGFPSDVENNSAACRIINTRSNPGDDTTFNVPESIIEVDLHYEITEVECSEPTEKEVEDKDANSPTFGQIITVLVADCSTDVYATLPSVSKTPYAKEIWGNTTAASDSIFRRIYPKTGENTPVSCIADIPAESNATYTVNSKSDSKISLWRVELPDGSATQAEGKAADSVETRLFYPHIGGVLEYFLKGIQTALRPKGFGEQITNGQYCSNIICGELPEKLPKATGSCNLGSTSPRVGDIPQSLKDIISAAADTYKVAPNLIVAMMFGEGAFNTDPKGNYSRYNWTDQNVKNWATCQPLPNCTGPQTSIVSGLALNWSNYEKEILPELKKIDPTKTEADACNLIDEIYAIALNLRQGAGGGVDLKGKTCYGITMSSTTPTSCSWGDDMIETAIRVYQLGSYWNPTSTTANVSCPYPGGCNCATLPGSCAAGGGIKAGCDKPGDSCEQNGSAGNTSHNACVFDVANGN